MINIQHTYTTQVEIIYGTQDGYGLHETTCSNMDEIAEHVCEVLVKHNFTNASVCSIETGEVLMTVERS